MFLRSRLPPLLLLFFATQIGASEFKTQALSSSSTSRSDEETTAPLSFATLAQTTDEEDSTPEFHDSDFMSSSEGHSGSEDEGRTMGLTMDSRENLELRQDFLREMRSRWERGAVTRGRVIMETDEESEDGPHKSDFEFTTSSSGKKAAEKDPLTGSDSSSLEIRRVDPITTDGRNLNGLRRRESTEEILRQTLLSQKEMARTRAASRRRLERSRRVTRPPTESTGDLFFSLENELGMRMDLNTEEAKESTRQANPKKPRKRIVRPDHSTETSHGTQTVSNSGIKMEPQISKLSPESITRLAHQLSGVNRRSSSGEIPTISNSRAPSPHETSGSAASFEEGQDLINLD